MTRWPLFLFLIMLLLTCRAAPGEIRVTRVDGGGHTDWAMIQLEFPAQAGPAEVSVQDARGGMAVACPVPAGVVRMLLPLPLLAPEQLKSGAWPVEATLRTDGRVIEQAAVNVAMESEDVYRVAVAAGTPEQLLHAIDWQVLTARRVVFVPLPADAYAAPPLLFAGCDAVVTSANAPFNDVRQRAIIAVGTRIISVTPASANLAPPDNAWVWEQLGSSNGAAAWIIPAVPIRRPAVIEPGLADLGLAAPAPPPRLIAAAMLTGPIAIIVVLLMRGLFRKPRHIMLAATLGLAAVAGGFAAYVRVADSAIEQHVRLHLAAARADAATGATFIDEQICSRTSFVVRPFSMTASEGCLVPLAPTARAYFARRDVRLILDGTAIGLECNAPSHQILRYATRRAHPAGVFPAFPTTADAQRRLADALRSRAGASWWVFGGYIYPADALPDNWEGGVLFTAWAKTQPDAIGEAARAWDALHSDATHRYFMWQDAGELNWIDYGVAPAGP